MNPSIFIIPSDTPPIEKMLAAANCDPFTLGLINQGGGIIAEQAKAIQWVNAYALHWVFKIKWDSKHKIPGWNRLRNDTRKGIKLYADYLYRLLELCLQLGFAETRYKNAGERFCCIYWEIKRESIDDIVTNTDTKSEIIAQHKQRLGALQKYSNPYSHEFQPHSWMLFDIAIQQSEGMDLFRLNYWKPFLSAYTHWVSNMYSNSTWVCTFRKEGKHLYHPKESKSVKYLYSPSARMLTP